MKKFYCPHCPQEFTRRWNMKRHISKMHPSSTLGENFTITYPTRSTSNVYSPLAGSPNYAADGTWIMLLSQKLDEIKDLQRTTNQYLINIFYAIIGKK